jgi:hypothetical protein
LAYRWYFGANLIPGATNALLTLTNVGFTRAGNYSVVVTNAYGSATGGPAVLTVVDTIPPTIISCASNRTFSVGANCTASLPNLTGEVVATDASGAVTVIQIPAPGTLLGPGRFAHHQLGQLQPVHLHAHGPHRRGANLCRGVQGQLGRPGLDCVDDTRRNRPANFD